LVKKNEFKKAFKDPKKAIGIAKTRLDFESGKLFFKNTAGLKNNLDGTLTNLSTKKITKKSNSLSHDRVLTLKTKGYVNFEYPFDTSLLDQIQKEYLLLIENDKTSFVRTEHDGKVYSRMIKTAWKTIPSSQKLITDEIKIFVEEYFQRHFQILDITAWRNYSVETDVSNEKELFASHWHCDGKNTSIITLFINLMNVTENNGPFMIQSKERTKELIKMGFGSRHEYNLPMNIVEDSNHVVSHTGKIGSSMIVTTEECLHRASHPKDGNFRDILQIRFIPSNEPLKDDWSDHCIGIDFEKLSKEKLQKQLQIHT
jgi:hypothetical protein